MDFQIPVTVAPGPALVKVTSNRGGEYCGGDHCATSRAESSDLFRRIRQYRASAQNQDAFREFLDQLRGAGLVFDRILDWQRAAERSDDRRARRPR